MDPFQRSRRENKKRHARAQRRYARRHPEKISQDNKRRYLVKKQKEARLASIAEMESRERAERDAFLNQEPPSVSLRQVWDRPYDAWSSK